MSLYNVGNFIKQKRVELGITQEELCEGICSVTTLSRLENGEQTPRSSNVRALLQRLGYSGALFFQTAGKEEFEITELQIELRQTYNLHDYGKSQSLLAKLEEYKSSFSDTDFQFYQIMYAVMHKKDLSNFEVIKMLENALRLTHPKYSIKNLPKVLTYEEATALNNIAAHLGLEREYDEAIKILFHLKDYYERRVVDIQEAQRALPTILYNLSKFLGLSGRYDECISVCNQGIRIAKESGRSRCLARTLYNLSWALVKLGRPCDIEPARQAAKEAYCLSKLLENRPEFLERMSGFIKTNFGEESPLII